MSVVKESQLKQIHEIVEEELDHKINHLASFEKQHEKLVSLTTLIMAALSDAGHVSLAKYIEREIKKAKFDV